MTTEQFETWSLYIGVAVLISFMFFIIYDLGKKSGEGKFGNFILSSKNSEHSFSVVKNNIKNYTFIDFH